MVRIYKSKVIKTVHLARVIIFVVKSIQQGNKNERMNYMMKNLAFQKEELLCDVNKIVSMLIFIKV